MLFSDAIFPCRFLMPFTNTISEFNFWHCFWCCFPLSFSNAIFQCCSLMLFPMH
jgi:hypothetical protein